MKSIYIPVLDDVEELHEVVLLISGGKDGIHDRKLLISAIERPATYIGYQEEYDVDTICALLIDSLARYHGFRDGNKRTALMTAIWTYRLNDVHFTATDSMNTDFDNMVMWVVTEKPEIDDIASKLKELRKLYECDSKANWRDIFTSFANAVKNHKD